MAAVLKPATYSNEMLLALRHKLTSHSPSRSVINRIRRLGIRRFNHNLEHINKIFSLIHSLAPNSAYAFYSNLQSRSSNNTKPKDNSSRGIALRTNHRATSIINTNSLLPTVNNTRNLLPTILLTNAHSIVDKTDDLCQVIEDTTPDIVCISETWLNSSNKPTVVNLLPANYLSTNNNRTLSSRQRQRRRYNDHGQRTANPIHIATFPKAAK